jgi:proteasome accessory factor C
MLVMLPWLMERGSTPVAAVAERFRVTEAQVVKDIELASCCGLPPYVEEMIDVYVDEGMVEVGAPRIFTRPLRLTAKEGVTLLAAVRVALALPGADAGGALARAATKLEAAVGVGPVVADVEQPPLFAVVERATRESQRLRITYYTASRDELTERTIDPQAIFMERGNWYVMADDELSGEARFFRIDRIEVATVTGEHFVHRDVDRPSDSGWFGPDDSRVVVLDLPEAAGWVAETYPVRSVGQGEDGRWRVELDVASERWLARLLLRVGPDAVVEEPEDLRGVARKAAAEALSRYR